MRTASWIWMGLAISTSQAWAAAEAPEAVTQAGKVPSPLLSEFPHLEQYVDREKDAGIRFGFGVSPVRIMKSKAGVALSIFQIHLTRGWLDWEIFSASFGTSISGEAVSKVNSFTFRTVPKFRITPTLSVGPVLGLEFVSFPDVEARLNKNNFFTPPGEPFSSRGYIFGFAASQTFKVNDKFTFRVNEMFYKQNYDIKGTGERGWNYFYANNQLNLDPTPIEPGPVFLIEFSLLY